MRRPRASSACRKACSGSGSYSRIAPRLVRGFDYYTSTVLEPASGALDGAQKRARRRRALRPARGGDGWSRLRPRSGLARGSTACCCACDDGRGVAHAAAHVDAFVVDMVGTPDAMLLLAELRESGLAADRSYTGRAAKKQMAAADKSGARWALILGEKELERGVVSVKDLQSGEQREVARAETAAWLHMRKDEPAT